MGAYISRSKQCYNAKLPAYNFYVKTKIFISALVYHRTLHSSCELLSMKGNMKSIIKYPAAFLNIP